MNRALFISDFNALARLHTPEDLPGVIANYVQKIPINPGHSLFAPSVPKEKVIRVCCSHFKTSLKKMATKDRHWPIRYSRYATIYLLSKRTRLNQEDIALIFNRDRTTVVSSIQALKDVMETDCSLREEIEQLNAQL
jgi:chromosomal replication initiation ATPase DnaA